MKNYIYTFAAIATVLTASCDDMNELVAQGDYALTSQDAVRTVAIAANVYI